MPGDQDAGLMAHAYDLTGDPRWAGRSSRRVRALARSLVGPRRMAAFLCGWSGVPFGKMDPLM